MHMLQGHCDLRHTKATRNKPTKIDIINNTSFRPEGYTTSVAVFVSWASLILDSTVVLDSPTGSVLIEVVLLMDIGGTNWSSFFLNNIMNSVVVPIVDQN